MNSLDLDNDNPESEPDLDAPSLVSFNPSMGVESSLRSLDQHEADTSLGNIGHKTMTIGFSLGSLIQQKQDGQEGMTIQTAWDPSLDPSNDKKKKRVTFSKATLEAYKATKPKQAGNKAHSLGSLSTTLRSKSFQNKITKEQLPKLAGISFSKSKRCSNSLQQLRAKKMSLGQTITTA